MTRVTLRIDDGKHRQATWLELFFDLAFVISVSHLTHLFIADPTLKGFFHFALLFVPVWWCWNQYTWYASHFDNDDTFMRLFMLWGIAGTLFLSKGLQELHHGHVETFVFSYVFMHVGMAVAWLRVYGPIVEYRRYITFKFVGVTLGIILWPLSLLWLDQSAYLWALAVGLQLLMPIMAWKTVTKMISVHQHHLLERHGLFVIILLGECLLAMSKDATLSLTFVLCLLGLFGVWWLYFDWRYNPLNLKVTTYAFAFNYGHFILYLSLGMIAAGIGLGADYAFMVATGSAGFILALGLMNWISNRERNTQGLWIRMGLALTLLTLSLAVEMPATVILSLNLGVLFLAIASNSKKIT